MRKTKSRKTRPLVLKVRSQAFRAPMGGAGPHRDRKNAYRRRGKIKNWPEEPFGNDGSFIFPVIFPPFLWLIVALNLS